MTEVQGFHTSTHIENVGLVVSIARYASEVHGSSPFSLYQITSACGMLSGVATAGLLLYLIVSNLPSAGSCGILIHCQNSQWSAYGIGAKRTSSNGFRSFLGTDAGKYLVSLIVVDLFHAVAYTSGLHWVRLGGTKNTGACTFQGIPSPVSHNVPRLTYPRY